MSRRTSALVGVAALVAATCLASADASAKLVQVRVGNHPTYTRVVFELDAPSGYRIERRASASGGGELLVTLEAGSPAMKLKRSSVMVERVDVRAGSRAVARVRLRKKPSRVKEMILANPPRIVFDLVFPEDLLARAQARARAPAPPPAPKAKPVAKSKPPAPKAKPVAKSEPPAPKAKPVAKSEPPAPKAKPVAKSEPPAPKAKPVAKSEPPAPKAKPVAKIQPPAPKPEPVAKSEPPEPQPAPAIEPPAPKPEPVAKSEPPAPEPEPLAEVEPLVPEPEPLAGAEPPAPPMISGMPEVPGAATPQAGEAPAPKLRQPKPPSASRPAPAPAEPEPAGPGILPAALTDLWAEMDSGVWIRAAAAVLLMVLLLFARLYRRKRRLPNDAEVAALADEAGLDGGLEGAFAMGDETEGGPLSAAGASGSVGIAAGPGLLDDDSDKENETMDLENQERTMDQTASEMPTVMGAGAAGGGDIASLVRDLERRVVQLETRLDETTEARERLERQVAAQAEELRVQRAAIARTQRALRGMNRPAEEQATEPAIRDSR